MWALLGRKYKAVTEPIIPEKVVGHLEDQFVGLEDLSPEFQQLIKKGMAWEKLRKWLRMMYAFHLKADLAAQNEKVAAKHKTLSFAYQEAYEKFMEFEREG